MFSSIFKAAAAVVEIPVSVVADVATAGGALSDNDTTYTEASAARLVENLKNITEPD